MSTLTDRIRPWTQNPPRNSPDGELAIIVLEHADCNGEYFWLAIHRRQLVSVAQGGPHPTRHDAVVDAIEHVPNWDIIRTL